jgi:predicted TIM-barrel fold metal-dependent hydrolase
MIVDCHTHISFAADEGEISEHLATSETVDACIVLATADGPTEVVNKRLAEYVNKHETRLVGFAIIIPTQDKIDVDSLNSVPEKLGLKGFVLYCSGCGFHPADSRAMQFYESAQQLSMPVFFHNSSYTLGPEAVLTYAQPYLLDEIAREFPQLKIVIGNMGVPFFEQTLSMVAKHENVYADLTIRPSNVWQTYNIVVAAHERGVMDKLLFGSGYPLGNAQQCMETLLGFNMLLADTNLPAVPRGSIRNIIERDTLELLGIEHSRMGQHEQKSASTLKEKATNSHG